MTVRARVKGLLRSIGWSVGRYDYRSDPVAIRQRLLAEAGVDLVLDVGANSGQFAQQIRREGYRGRIVSFEPLGAAYAALVAAAGSDPAWQVRHCALGAEPGSAEINVAGNSWSSSLLPMLERHLQAAPESGYVGTETVAVHTLDELWPGLGGAGSRVFLKIDAQGFTLQVLAGAADVLPSVQVLQVELSLVPLYEGEPLIGEVLVYLYERQFRLAFLEPEFGDSRGDQLQVNGLLVRR